MRVIRVKAGREEAEEGGQTQGQNMTKLKYTQQTDKKIAYMM